jgi:hypothetical protein
MQRWLDESIGLPRPCRFSAFYFVRGNFKWLLPAN